MSRKVDVVDVLGVLRAKIAELSEAAKKIESDLKARGNGEYEGNLFRAVVSTSERETLVAEKVREFLHPNQLRHATQVSEVVSIRVSARQVA
jgi:hypothetical protein